MLFMLLCFSKYKIQHTAIRVSTLYTYDPLESSYADDWHRQTPSRTAAHKRMGFLSSQFVYRMKMAEHKFLLSSYHIGFCGVHNCQFMMRIYSFFWRSGLAWDRGREDDMSAGSGSGMEQIVRISFHFTSWYDAHAQFKADLHLLWTLAEN